MVLAIRAISSSEKDEALSWQCSELEIDEMSNMRYASFAAFPEEKCP
jgi:hypothetical protein